MILYRRLRIIIAIILVAAPGNLQAMVALRPVSCDFVCQGGGCSYTNCVNGPSCPGGACSFDGCQRPSCAGGNCDFVSCQDPDCRGGNCRVFNPLTTLRDGYCDGGACEVENRPFPSRFAGRLSI